MTADPVELLADVPGGHPVVSVGAADAGPGLGRRHRRGAAARWRGGRPRRRAAPVGAVAVLALDDADRVLLVHQYRHPVGPPVGAPGRAARRRRRGPAGGRAARELWEETAPRGRRLVGARRLLHLARACCDEALRIYLARGRPALGRRPARPARRGARTCRSTWVALDDAARRRARRAAPQPVARGRRARRQRGPGGRLDRRCGRPTRRGGSGRASCAEPPSTGCPPRQVRPGEPAVAVRAGALRGARVIPPTPGAVEPADNDVGSAREPRGTCIAVKVGIPREVKNHEYRVAITPAGVLELDAPRPRGLRRDATPASARRSPTRSTSRAGATILPTADDVWGDRRPDPQGQGADRGGVPPHAQGADPVHLPAPGRRRGRAPTRCSSSGVTAIAYETVELPDRVAAAARPDVRGRRPAGPAGRRARRCSAPTAAAACSWAACPACTPPRSSSSAPASPGMNAAAIALGMQAEVLAARPQHRAAAPDGRASTRATCRPSRPTPTRSSGPSSTPTWSSARCSCPGAKAPKLITNELVSRMKPGSVLVDIAIDQGGCFEDSRPTTHADPTYPVHDSVFYCVANMPGAVPNTSTYALTNVTLPYAVELANKGWRQALPRRPRAGARPEHPRGRDHLRRGRRGLRACRRWRWRTCSPDGTRSCGLPYDRSYVK